MSSKNPLIITVGAGKGGTGKDNTAANLAVTAAYAGRVPVIIDLDSQGTSVKWGKRREQAPSVIGTDAARLRTVIDAVTKKGADLIIINTPPHTADTESNPEVTSLEASRVADLLLIPVKPSRADVETLPTTFSLHALSGSTAPALVLFNQYDVRTTTLLRKAVAEVDRLGYPRIPDPVPLLAEFQHAWDEGMGVAEYAPNGTAAQEMSRLWSYVETFMAGRA